ncbi:MAG: M14 family metallopeptidase [Thermoplasmatota archaeon]
MGKQSVKLIGVFLIFFLIFPVFSGCLDEKKNDKNINIPKDSLSFDDLSVLPDWDDAQYHDYEAMVDMLHDFDYRYPGLVNIFSIGKSVVGRDIWCIQITNEQRPDDKYACVIDGCIHGNEWEAGEACLYLAEYLLINFESNATITQLLNKTEVYIVPFLNPDGREKDDRFNANGIDLNRNFDAHFGRVFGGSLPVGNPFGLKIISYIKRPLFVERLGFDRFIRNKVWTNSGRQPFSEPETQALRMLLDSIQSDLAFYVNCHTAMHMVLTPVNVRHRPEFSLTSQEKEVFKQVLNWCENNTEYQSVSPDHEIGFGGGVAHHWVFKAYRIPSFCFEILSREYEPGMDQGKHDQLNHWMKTTIPFFLFLFENIEPLYNWKNPTYNPFLPEGIPPSPMT